jgi:NAD(P)H dehydrogenase (quinone)
MTTVLVTAASGSAGRSFVEALLDKGFDVIATSRKPETLSFSRRAETRAYDADRETDFDPLFAGVDDIVLVAPPLDGCIDVKLAPFIRAAADRKVGHLVYLSGNYLSGMTGTTLEALPVRKLEHQIIASGLKHTILRAGFFMDNYTTGFYATMVGQGRISLATGAGKSALIAGADVGVFVAEALAQGLTGEYVLTGLEALDHYEVAALLSRKLGKTITYTPVTEPQLEEYYRSKGLDPESLEYGLTLYRSYRNYATAAVTDAFKQATGRDPVSLSAFLGLA